MNQILLLCFLSVFLLFLTHNSCTAQTPAPGPSGPANVTKILEKAGQFTVYLRLLQTTQVGSQINTQLNNSNNGMTVFAPTDNAFSSLPAGALNSLSDRQKVELIQFHVLSSFLSTAMFQTVSNPLRTQSGNDADPLNVTSSGNQVNLTTGVVNATLGNTIYTDGQFAVYQVDKVLLPFSIFGTPAPSNSPAPAPEAADKNVKKKKKADSPSGGAGVDGTGDSSGGKRDGFENSMVGILLIAIAAAFPL
ncbi:fasciclin-like arabinogalactan protein 11 [Impatiens glandulifera]|uniref:fasciclin-like arabinogalactan protein 11 n=1 Tax=Impatiens glandulifera TaxID=253017 RepID=UPI001FB17C0D|nr:fasciclin-like arabinogalactan protein 11 [Impatiens glandulifera]